VLLRAPNLSQTLDGFHIEGRYGASASVDWSRRAHLTFGPAWSHQASLTWLAVDDSRYLDPGYYDDAGIVELRLGSGVATRHDEVQATLRTSVAGGLAYNRAGLGASGRTDLDPFYFRGTIEATARRSLAGANVAARLFAGVASGDHVAAKQRQIYLQGSDPLEQLYNPFLRSRGALLVGDDFHYQDPGGAGVRWIDSRISTGSVIALNLELERGLATRPSAHLFNRIALAAFTDLAQVIRGSVQPLTGDRLRFLADAGVGVRAEHRIGDTRFSTRVDFPLYVNQPGLAQDRDPGDEKLGFRWVFSFEPSF
jgi:hypothetical protein